LGLLGTEDGQQKFVPHRDALHLYHTNTPTKSDSMPELRARKQKTLKQAEEKLQGRVIE